MVSGYKAPKKDKGTKLVESMTGKKECSDERVFKQKKNVTVYGQFYYEAQNLLPSPWAPLKSGAPGSCHFSPSFLPNPPLVPYMFLCLVGMNISLRSYLMVFCVYKSSITKYFIPALRRHHVEPCLVITA